MTEEAKIDEKELKVGAGVVLAKNRAGIIRYRGKIEKEDGEWFGIELVAGASEKKGTNGVRSKKRYFFAPKGRAIFCTVKDIIKVLTKVNSNSKSQFFNIVDPAERIDGRSPQDWTTNDVARWLAKIDALDAITIFLVNNVTGAQFIKLSEKDLESKLSITDKELRDKIVEGRKQILNRAQLLPDLTEGKQLDTGALDPLDEQPASDTIMAPPLGNPDGEPWRLRSKSSPLVKKSPRKRDSYSVPEKLRGKLPPMGGRRQVTQNQYPPPRGSFRDDSRKILFPPVVSRFHSTPARTDGMLASDRQENADNPLPDLDDFTSSATGLGALSEQPEEEKDAAEEAPRGRPRSASLTKFIESHAMEKWPCPIVVKWINSLGGKASSYGELFRDKELTGVKLETITPEALTALGVKEPGVRKWIISSRDTLLEAQPNQKTT